MAVGDRLGRGGRCMDGTRDVHVVPSEGTHAHAPVSVIRCVSYQFTYRLYCEQMCILSIEVPP